MSRSSLYVKSAHMEKEIFVTEYIPCRETEKAKHNYLINSQLQGWARYNFKLGLKVKELF